MYENTVFDMVQVQEQSLKQTAFAFPRLSRDQ